MTVRNHAPIATRTPYSVVAVDANAVTPRSATNRKTGASGNSTTPYHHAELEDSDTSARFESAGIGISSCVFSGGENRQEDQTESERTTKSPINRHRTTAAPP